MKLTEIKALAAMMAETELTALEWNKEGETLRLERNPAPVSQVPEMGIPSAAYPGMNPDAALSGTAPFGAAAPVETATGEQKPAVHHAGGSPGGASPVEAPAQHWTLSPMVGVFYAAPAPDRDPYVQVGDRVKKGDVLCIVEAMKLMNEIQSEVDGIVAEVHVGNGQVVEFEQPLFRISLDP